MVKHRRKTHLKAASQTALSAVALPGAKGGQVPYPVLLLARPVTGIPVLRARRPRRHPTRPVLRVPVLCDLYFWLVLRLMLPGTKPIFGI